MKNLQAYIIPFTGVESPTIPTGSQNGFVSSNGYRNPTVTIDGHVLRERSELLLLKEDKILIQRRDEWELNDYKIPGGATDPDLTVVETAIKECKEEALIVATNVKYYGAYTMLFGKDVPKWLQNRNNGKFPIDYEGYYTHCCVGIYDHDYEEKIAEEDQDTFYKLAKWVPISEAKKYLRKEHVRAIDQYLLSARGITI